MRCFLLAPFSGQQRAGRKGVRSFDLHCLCGVEGCSLGLRRGDWTQELGQYWRIGVGWMGQVWGVGEPQPGGDTGVAWALSAPGPAHPFHEQPFPLNNKME